MKKQQKYFLGMIVAGAVLIVAAGVSAQLYPFNQTLPTTTPTTLAPGIIVATPAPTVVEIDNSGNVLLRGVLTSSNATTTGTSTSSNASSSFTLNSWGGEWMVRMNNETQTLPSSGLASMSVGNFIGVDGTMAVDRAFTIDANLVRDWTMTPDSISGVGGSTASAEALYTGVVSDVGSSSFTLTDPSGMAYTVLVDPSVTLWNTARDTITFADIQVGHSIRVDGFLNGDMITATIVRDISL